MSEQTLTWVTIGVLVFILYPAGAGVAYRLKGGKRDPWCCYEGPFRKRCSLDHWTRDEECLPCRKHLDALWTAVWWPFAAFKWLLYHYGRATAILLKAILWIPARAIFRLTAGTPESKQAGQE